MNAHLAKVAVIATLLLCLVPVYFLMPPGDRGFAVVEWLVFSVVVGFLVLKMPVLYCPDCGRATRYFDNYYEWTNRLTGGFRRNVMCALCGCVIDRLSGARVTKVSRAEARSLSWLVWLIRMQLALLWVGLALIACSIGVGIIIWRVMHEENGRQDRGRLVLLGCGVVFLLGLASLGISWWLKVKAKGYAKDRDIQLGKSIRVRW